jgi:hypothetical protein
MLPRSLSFLKESKLSSGIREISGADFEFDLLDSETLESIPNVAGVYVIVSTDGTKFIYPNGKCSVMYIGMSKHLKVRIKEHYVAVKSVTDNLNLHKEMCCQCNQRYHYFRVFGAKVYVFTRRGPQDPKEMEASFLGKFYEKYLSLPISNSARSFSQK